MQTLSKLKFLHRLILLTLFFSSYFSVKVFAQETKDSLKYFPLMLHREFDTSLTNDSLFLLKIAQDTWNFFDNSTYGSTGLIVDNVGIENGFAANYTSITNIGLYILCVISAEELSIIKRNEALAKISATFNSLEKLEKYNGFFFNWYDLTKMKRSGEFISAVDAAWLYSSLAVLKAKYPVEFDDRCESLMKDADFSWLYNKEVNAFNLGYDTNKNSFSPYNYQLLCSEARIAFYYSVYRGFIEPVNWYFLQRTLPLSFEQEQQPDGDWKQYDSLNYFEGYYNYKNIKVIPSWGGSMFEYLMPGILFDELRAAPYGMGLNNSNLVKIHIDYALNDLGYDIWGMSPCSIPTGGYEEYGVDKIGVSKDGYKSGVVTPHASFLALNYFPHEVIDNIKIMINQYKIYGEYGLYDSVDPLNGNTGYNYLALDQAMILVSITNYLKDGCLTNLFMNLNNMDKMISILSDEKIFQ